MQARGFVTIAVRGVAVPPFTIPIQSRLMVLSPHLFPRDSLQLFRLRVHFTTTWLLQVGSPPDTITARLPLLERQIQA